MNEKVIVVQLTKRRWIVAEWRTNSYVTITNKLSTHWEAAKVCSEILNLDEAKYSQITKNVLMESWDEL